MCPLCSQCDGTHGHRNRPFSSNAANASRYQCQIDSRACRIVCRLFQLGPQERCGQLTGRERGTDVDPRVFVDFPAGKPSTIGPFLTNDLGAFNVIGTVHEQRAALSGNDVLGFMKTRGGQHAEPAERSAPIRGAQRLSGVFDHRQGVRTRDRHDGVHLAGHPCVVHRHDGARPLRDGGLDLTLVDIESVGPDVDEDGHAAAKHERVGGRDERERRHDDFVARLNAGDKRRHLERSRAGLRQERPAASDRICQPLFAPPRELPVARQMRPVDRFANVVELPPGDVRPIEWHHRHQTACLARPMPVRPYPLPL